MIERAVRRVAHVPRIRTTVTSSRWMAPLTSRFVAGTTTGDALGVAADLASQGLRITAHVRQGDGASDSAATGHVESYGALMHGLSRCDVPDPEVSVKIRQLGYQPGAPTAPVLDRLAHLARCALDSRVRLTVDMEWLDEVDDTLALTSAVRAVNPDVAVAVQANLRRTESDVTELARAGWRVRLVKGAYRPPAQVAYRRPSDVRDAYRRCGETLLRSTAQPLFATHDPLLLADMRHAARRLGRGTDSYEIQMLLGIRPDEQRRLAGEGERVRVYVPYGPDWYGWFVSRVADRPQTLLLAGRSAWQTAQR